MPPIDKLIAEHVKFEAAANPSAAAAAPPAIPAAPPAAVTPPAEVVAPPSVAASPPAARPAAPAELGHKLGTKVHSAPGSFAGQFDAALVRVLGDQPPAAETLAGLEPEDRDVLLGVVDGLTNFRALVRSDANALPTEKIRPLLDMADRLRSKADLAIVNPQVVTRVRGYGSYDPIVPLRLPAGVAHKPALYYEIENFGSRIDEKGLYRTVLRQDVVIYDAGGSPVLDWPNEAVIDLCRRQRHDLYFAKVFGKPINLPPGTYTIKITLTDAQRMAEAHLSLVITPPPGAPAPVGGPTGPVGPVGPGGVR